MKKHLLYCACFLTVATVLQINIVQVFAIPYPEPPSDEQKEEWRRMGDENLKKYGSGDVSNSATTTIRSNPTVAPIATATTQPTPSLTLDVNESKTEIASVGGVMEDDQDVFEEEEQRLKWYHRFWRWFRKSFWFNGGDQ